LEKLTNAPGLSRPLSAVGAIAMVLSLRARMPGIFVALLSLCALAAKPIATTEPGYRIDSWDTEDGLPENSATAMVQDRAGYLWLGTFGGLVRSEGSKLERFDSSNLPQLPSEAIVNLHLDAAGRMWISTANGLVIRDQSGWHKPEGWAGNFVRTFSERPNGDLLLTTFNGLVLEWTGGRLRQLPLPPGGAKDGYFGYADENGAWWVVRYDFIGHWDGRQWVRAQEFGRDAFACCAARDGGMWLFNWTGLTLHKYRHGREVTRIKLPENPGEFWDMSEDREGNVWICTQDRGVCLVSSSGELRRWDTSNGLAADSTRFVFQDAEQNIWVGTNGGGLNRLKRKRFQTIGTAQGLPERAVHSVFPTADGSLLIGTYGGGLVRMRDGALEPVSLPGWHGDRVNIQSVLADRAGRLWVGTFQQGLWLWESGKFRHIAPNQTGGDNVTMLFEDSRGRVWMDGSFGINVYEAGEFRPIATHRNTLGEAFRFTEDAAGTIWAANRSGVFRYDSSGAMIDLIDGGNRIRGVISIYGDAEGAVWIASDEAGLLCYREGKSTRIDAASGIPASDIHAMIEDRFGYLWMTSSRGLYRVKRDELLAYAEHKRCPLTVSLFNRDDGLVGVEFYSETQPQCARDRDGRLWFASPQGLVTVDPANVRLNSRPPPVEISAMTYRRANRSTEDTVVAPGNAAADQVRLVGPFTRPPLLPPGSRWIEIHFTALSFAAPSKVRYQVKLEPRLDWQDVGNQRMTIYRELQPGNYVIHVRAANNDGVWNEAGTTLAFTVMPFYWQTAWFKSGMAFSVVGLVGATGWGFLRLRHRREMRLLRQRNEMAHLSRVAMLGELSGSMAHELNQPLAAILGNAQAARRMLERGPVEQSELCEILTDIIDQDKRAGEIITRLRLLLKKGEVNRQMLDMNELVGDVLRLLAANLSSQNVTVRTDLETGLPPVNGDRVQLQQVLLNLLMNAAESVAGGPDGERSITVRTRRFNGESVRTSVIDRGGGIAADRLESVFEPYFTTKSRGLGLGLAVCRTIVTAHGGTLTAANNPDRGAAFHVTLFATEAKR
jgi:signal transduction histidine kinase/ligand-binding sensor domain-containing protein